MSRQPIPDRTPKGQRGIGSTLFYVLLATLVLGIAMFVVLRPGGKGTTSPSAPTSQH